MLRLSVIFLFSIFAWNVQADQQAILSKEEAEKTVAFLETQEEIIIYCGCCSNHKHEKIRVTSVSYECEYIDWCEVRVEGTNTSTQEAFNETIDLAYAWVNVDGVAKNLAWEMDMNASPCATSFDWDTYESVQERYYLSKDKKEIKEFDRNLSRFSKKLQSEKNFERETFESGKVFLVKEVTVERDFAHRSIVISHIGDSIEQRYEIPLNKIKSFELKEEGIEVRAMEDGAITVEEFVNSELKYRMFWFVRTVPVIDVSTKELEYLRYMSEHHRGLTKQ